MLDKSLPYKSIIMRMEAAVAERLAPPAPAAGYRIRPFAPGDERHWARIETSVGEFSEEAAARAYFERVYLPEAALRCLFVVTERDEPVATATTWTEEEASLRQLQLQWVAVEPAHQRRNLFFPIKVINFILVYLHHVQRIAILPYCHLLRFFLYHFCTTLYFTSENGLLCSHRFTEIQTQFNGVSHSPIMRH